MEIKRAIKLLEIQKKNYARLDCTISIIEAFNMGITALKEKQGNEEKYAKDIKDCESCPLYKNDCSGGATGTPSGYKEPPCTSWNDDTLIYEGMYDSNY